MVIGSDGIWEYLSNTQVGEIVFPFHKDKNSEGAAECLVKKAYSEWKKRCGQQVDDVTCVVIFFK